MLKKKYQLVPTKTFLKDLKKVDPKLKKKISKLLDSLQENPFQGKKLTAIEIRMNAYASANGDYGLATIAFAMM